MEITWLHPERWWLLVAVAAIAVFWLWASRTMRERLKQFAHPAALEQLSREVVGHRRWIKFLLVITALVMLVLALMGPQWGMRWQEITRRGVDIVVALDVSRSMLAEDVRPNRLERAKLAIQEFVQLLPGDRIGLVLFSGTAFEQCPLTVDYNAFLLTLDQASTSILPHGGTALGRAIHSSLRAFREGSEGSRALIVMTDGEDHEGDLDSVIQEAKEKDVRIYTLGIGTPEGELIPVVDSQGRSGFVKDDQGRVVKSRLNEPMLQELALGTGGAYLRAQGVSFGLDRLYKDHIAKLDEQEYESRMQEQRLLRYQWPLALGFLLLLLEPLIADARHEEVA